MGSIRTTLSRPWARRCFRRRNPFEPIARNIAARDYPTRNFPAIRLYDWSGGLGICSRARSKVTDGRSRQRLLRLHLPNALPIRWWRGGKFDTPGGEGAAGAVRTIFGELFKQQPGFGKAPRKVLVVSRLVALAHFTIIRRCAGILTLEQFHLLSR